MGGLQMVFSKKEVVYRWVLQKKVAGRNSVILEE